MSAANTDKLLKVGKPGTATTLSSPGHTSGGTSITVGSTTNWPTDTAVAFAIDRAELVAGEEVQIPGTYTEWIGVVSGATTITDMVLSGDSPNSDQTYASGSLTRVYIPVSATRENKLVEWGLTHADQDGTLKAGAVDVAGVLASNVVTYPKLESELQGGWNSTSALPAISTVVANGNRSYTLTHASSIASVVSAGMRRRFTRTVAANTYMGGAFNGSSHYFTKTSPSGTLGTVTNNFTIEAVVQPTSYATGIIAGRCDAGGNNFFIIRMESTGQIFVGIANGAGANYRTVTTYQSISLNKKTHVAASWTSGTVVIYFDGVPVPAAAAATGGTAPTAAGTGGDFAIGRLGAASTQYFAGYISNVAVFDAVLSAATIKQHSTIKLLGSETNCIGAWSLDNTANDQSSAGNNLTATGGVGFTNKSPFGNNGVTNNLEYALSMSVSSDGLTEVVQCPEGCALPTTGGITASAYSSMANPYGFPDDKTRWAVKFINRLQSATASNATFAARTDLIFTVPAGNWRVGYNSGFYAQSTTSSFFCLSSANQTGLASTASDSRLQSSTQASAATVATQALVEDSFTHTTATTYTMYTCGATTAAGILGATTKSELFATPSGL